MSRLSPALRRYPPTLAHVHSNAPARERAGWLVGALVLLGLFLAAGLSLGGELAQVALAGLQVAPFVLLAGVWQLSLVWPRLRLAAWGLFWATLLLFGLLALALALAPLGMTEPRGGETAAPGSVALAVALLLGSLLLAIVLVLSGAWHALGERLGGHLLHGAGWHAQGLVGLLFFSLASLAPLVALGGEPPLLLLIAQQGEALDRGSGGEVLDLYYGLAWMLPLALVAAGVPVQRGLRAAAERLGFRSLGGRDLLILVGVTLALVAVSFGVDELVQAIWGTLRWPVTDADLVKQLFAATDSPLGAVSVGVSAGVGEELIARGLLQPRFGWFLPNLAFAAAHAFQYGPDALVSVFTIGAGFAAIRTRWNTTAAAFTHGLYDFILVMGGFLGVPGF